MKTSANIFTLILLIFFIPCNAQKKNNLSPSYSTGQLPVSIDSIILLKVNQNLVGYTIPQNFLGFSFEVGLLTRINPILNVNNNKLIQLYKNLGNGIIRIGGRSCDLTFWTGKPRNTNTGSDSLTTSDIDNFALFAKATGWQVLFGLNLGIYNTSMASKEAEYISKNLQDNLIAFQFGNEPDSYKSNGTRPSNYYSNNYFLEWHNYFQVLQSSLPNASFAGPETTSCGNWITNFASKEFKNLKILDWHYYVTGPASDNSISCESILTHDLKLDNSLQLLKAISKQVNLPFRISECNSIYSGGKKGVSDTFSSALWALEFMWLVADNNCQGVNFHGGGGGAYTPIAFSKGLPFPRPLYYAMLAFKFGTEVSNIVPVSLSQNKYNCSAYACSNGKQTNITIINKDTLQNLSFNISLLNNGQITKKIKVMRLRAPNIHSTSEVLFGGKKINDDGTFNVGFDENYTINGNYFNLNVPRASAAVIIVME